MLVVTNATLVSYERLLQFVYSTLLV